MIRQIMIYAIYMFSLPVILFLVTVSAELDPSTWSYWNLRLVISLIILIVEFIMGIVVSFYTWKFNDD